MLLSSFFASKTIPGDPRPDQSDGLAPLKCVYLGGDITNPTVILRIRSFLRQGVDVTSFCFRRVKFNVDFTPNWPDHPLGITTDRNYLIRLPSLLRGLMRIVAQRDVLRAADFIYARNTDMMLVGLLARRLTGSKAKLLYEVEDVPAVFFERSWAGRVLRWVERRALPHVDLLVAMSPGFLSGYFQPVQGYEGKSYVLENKIQPEDPTPSPDATPAPAAEVWRDRSDRWVIGWFGTLRCTKSMALLEEIATRLGPKVEIYTRGYPTETGLDRFLEIVNRHDNWTHEGEYKIPDDLEAMYGRVHFSWSLDFHDEFGNSRLLLPCRLYQGGYFGAVPLVMSESEVARWIAQAGIGHAFAPPYAQPVAEFLSGLSWETYLRERQDLLDRRDALFLEKGQDTARLLELVRSL